MTVGAAIDIITAPVAFIRGLVEWLLFNLTEAVLTVLSRFATMGFERFLFYPNPADVPVLDEIWWVSLSIFFGIVGLSVLYRLLMAQLFPQTDLALQLYLERVTKSLVVIVLSRELLALATEVTHLLAATFYRTGIDFSLGTTSLRSLVHQFGVVKSVVYVNALGAVLWIAGTGLVVVLIARMVVIYVTYSLLPVLMGLQLVTVGPWRQLRDLGETFVATSLKLMLFGVIVTAFLWISYAGLGVLDAGPAPDPGSEASGVDPIGPIHRVLAFVTPLLVIDYVGIQLIMEVT